MRTIHSAPLFLSLCVLVLTCCSSAEDNTPPDSEACHGAVVSSGFGFSWEKVNHRISLMKVEPRGWQCMSPVEQQAELATAFIGGDWSTGEAMTDVPTLTYNYQIASATDNLGFVSGSLDFDLAAPENQLQQTITVNLAQEHLTGFDEYVVLLNGLELDTRVDDQPDGYPDDYNPAHGYTSRGIGANLSILENTGSELRINALLRFDHGPSDRHDMNATMSYIRTKGRLHYLVVGVEQGSVETASVDYRLQYEKPELFDDVYLEPATEAQRQVSLSMPGDFDTLLVGWTSFNFNLDEDGLSDPDTGAAIGYYLRDISIQASIVEYDAQSGNLLLDLNGYASNASGFMSNYAFDNHFTGRAVAIGAGGVTVQRKTLEKTFDTGELLLPLTGDQQ